MPALEAVRKFSQKPVKVLAWISCHASALIYPFAHIEKGGRGDYRPKVMMETATSGKSVEEVAEKVLMVYAVMQEDIDWTPQVMTDFPGNVMHIPGLPPMYDYEFCPQIVGSSISRPLRF